MKLTLLFAALLSLPVVLMAEAGGVASATPDAATAKTETAGRSAHHPWLLEKFDADHNGQLSPAERDTAKAAVREKITERRAGRFQKLDADGNGQISRAEWDAAPAGHPRAAGALRQRILNRYDADKDGQLSPAERADARADFRRHLRQ
jgi:Ca2+-binding EF-hand superfamily protein